MNIIGYGSSCDFVLVSTDYLVHVLHVAAVEDQESRETYRIL